MSQSILLPPMCPDITLYSIVGLIARMNGSTNARAISEQLFGSPVAGMRHDFPSHLDGFCKRSQGVYGDCEFVAKRLTPLPYFLRFRFNPTASEAVEMLRGDNVERLKFHLGLPASPVGALLPLKHCAICADGDCRTYGFAYWHREHQLPSSIVCATHGTSLYQATLRTDGTGWSFLQLPTDTRRHGAPPIRLVENPHPILARMAILGRHALDSSLIVQDIETLRHAYLHGLRQNGLLTRSGRIRASDFVQQIEKAYRPISTLPVFNRIVGARATEGMLRLVRKPRAPANPVSHLVLIDFLFGNWDLFTSVLAWEGGITDVAMGSQATSIGPKPAHPEPPPDLREKLAAVTRRLETKTFSLSRACQDERIDLGTAMRWLGRLGHTGISKRPKILIADVLQHTIDLLRKGLPLIEIGRAMGLSKATIDRVCNESPELYQQWKAANWEWKRAKYRQALLAALHASIPLSVKSLRKLKGSGFSWLSRHDQVWLAANLPRHPAQVPQKPVRRRPRIDWAARDEECLQAVVALGEDIQLESWERRKPQAILRRLPRLSFRPRLERLPRSQIAVHRLLIVILRADPLS